MRVGVDRRGSRSCLKPRFLLSLSSINQKNVLIPQLPPAAVSGENATPRSTNLSLQNQEKKKRKKEKPQARTHAKRSTYYSTSRKATRAHVAAPQRAEQQQCYQKHKKKTRGAPHDNAHTGTGTRTLDCSGVDRHARALIRPSVYRWTARIDRLGMGPCALVRRLLPPSSHSPRSSSARYHLTHTIPTQACINEQPAAPKAGSSKRSTIAARTSPASLSSRLVLASLPLSQG